PKGTSEPSHTNPAFAGSLGVSLNVNCFEKRDRIHIPISRFKSTNEFKYSNGDATLAHGTPSPKRDAERVGGRRPTRVPLGTDPATANRFLSRPLFQAPAPPPGGTGRTAVEVERRIEIPPTLKSVAELQEPVRP